jgi:hypothetical protein
MCFYLGYSQLISFNSMSSPYDLLRCSASRKIREMASIVISLL